MRKAQILVIDDETIFLDFIRLMLEREHHEVTVSSGGYEAVNLINEVEWDVILTDLKMPVIDGFKLLEIAGIKQPDTPVIIMTGDEKLDNAVRAIQCGAYDFLTKSMSVKGSFLTIAVNRAIERRELKASQRRHLTRIEKQNRELLKDRNAAHFIQQSMIRKDFSFFNRRLHVASRYIPAEHVGGDFFDVLMIKPDTFLFYIADVAGHGVSAAMVTVFAKQTIKKLAALEGKRASTKGVGLSDPCSLLMRLNIEMNKQRFEIDGLPLYLTVFAGLLDAGTGDMVYSNAGHFPPPVILSSNNNLRYLELSGSPIGMFDEPEFELGSETLNEKEVLVLCTDGLTCLYEVHNGKSVYEKLNNILSFSSGLTNDQLAGRLLEETVKNFGKADQTDDITMLMISRQGRIESVNYKNSIEWRLMDGGIGCSFPSDLTLVDAVDERICDWLASRGLHPDLFKFRLLLREALVNSVRHGHNYDSSKIVTCDIYEGKKSITIIVQDEGPGFDSKKHLTKPFTPDSFNGRGLAIIKQYAESIEYNEKGNILTLIIPLEDAGND